MLTIFRKTLKNYIILVNSTYPVDEAYPLTISSAEGQDSSP